MVQPLVLSDAAIYRLADLAIKDAYALTLQDTPDRDLINQYVYEYTRLNAFVQDRYTEVIRLNHSEIPVNATKFNNLIGAQDIDYSNYRLTPDNIPEAVEQSIKDSRKIQNW